MGPSWGRRRKMTRGSDRARLFSRSFSGFRSEICPSLLPFCSPCSAAAVMPVQAGMNRELGSHLGSPLLATLNNFVGGSLIMLVLCAVFAPGPGRPRRSPQPRGGRGSVESADAPLVLTATIGREGHRLGGPGRRPLRRATHLLGGHRPARPARSRRRAPSRRAGPWAWCC